MAESLTEKDIKIITGIIMEQEMEKSHKAYLREKKRVLANLEGLKVAIKVIAEKDNREINEGGVIRIINNTIDFIKKGEM